MTRATHGAVARVIFLVPCLVLLAAIAPAQDWPSWRGRLQNGVSDQTGLVSSWSVDGENLIWFQEYVGRSTPAVFDGRVCANGRTGDGVAKREMVTCWNAEDGTRLWEHAFSVLNTTVPFNRVGWGSVTGDPETGYLYALNVDGHLHCFNRGGDIVWSWRLSEDLGRASGYGGRTSAPIIDEDRLVLSVIGSAWGDLGGPPRHRYVAFDKTSGRVRWVATPGGQPADLNTQSVPIIAVVNGQRLLIDGNADGHIYAMQARTGKKVWEFHLSQRGINVSPVIDGTTVYVGHSEENIDEGTMGRVVAIDATGRGDITATGEQWRLNELAVGFSSPLVNDGSLYVIDNSANLIHIDAGSGTVRWEHSIGNVGKSSPVWADGKLYVTEVNGNVQILQPGAGGATVLDTEDLEVEDGREAEIYGSFAPAYGRLYVTAESGIYCIGDPDAPFNALPGTTPALGPEAASTGAVASLQVVPAEVIAAAGETVNFRVLAFDANGQPVGERDATLVAGGPGRLASPRERRVPVDPAVEQPGRASHRDGGQRVGRRARAHLLAAALDRELRERAPAALDWWGRESGRGRRGGRAALPEGTVAHRYPPARHLHGSVLPVELHRAGRRAVDAEGPAPAGHRAHQQRLHHGHAGQPPADRGPFVGRRAAHGRAVPLRVGAGRLVHPEAARRHRRRPRARARQGVAARRGRAGRLDRDGGGSGNRCARGAPVSSATRRSTSTSTTCR